MLNAGGAAIGLRVLSVVMGVFLVLMGTGKLEWFGDSGFLVWQLEQWRDIPPAPSSRWYLETVAIPGAPLFARLIPLGEMSAGTALVAGFRVRFTAAIALAMILNFHFASGIIFTAGYFTNGYGPPVIGSLLALVLGGGSLPWSARRGRG